MTEKVYRAWHVCPADMMTVAHSLSPRMPIRIGETLEMHGNLQPFCGLNGLHGAVRLLDALGQCSDGRICLVDIWGDVHVTYNMIAGRYRRAVRIIPPAIVDIECRFFAASATHRLLMAERKAGREPAKASWDAVEVARRFAVGSASDSQLAKAGAAAEQAAEAAQAAWASAPPPWASVRATWAAAEAAGTAAEAARAAAVAARAAAVAVRTAGPRDQLSLELEDRLLRATGGIDG